MSSEVSNVNPNLNWQCSASLHRRLGHAMLVELPHTFLDWFFFNTVWQYK